MSTKAARLQDCAWALYLEGHTLTYIARMTGASRNTIMKIVAIGYRECLEKIRELRTLAGNNAPCETYHTLNQVERLLARHLNNKTQ